MNTRTMDEEANEFAMELLMPEVWLRRDIKALGGIDIEDEPAVNKLAKRYRVSPNVMVLRIGMLSARAALEPRHE